MANTPPTPPAPRTPPPVLAEIIEHKREEVRAGKAAIDAGELAERISAAGPTRDFVRAVTDRRQDPIAVIAEIKRKSPSAGWIRSENERFDPSVIAMAYANSGASAISCLTDKEYFGGSASYIKRIREAVQLPILRKDFLIDDWQVDQSRAMGADAVLLIAECLDDAQLADFADRAVELDLCILFEAHDRTNVERIVREGDRIGYDRCLIGINNRNLSTMVTDLGHTLDLAQLVEDRSRLVSESGISNRADLARLRESGISIVLVGERLMREDNPGLALAGLLGRG